MKEIYIRFLQSFLCIVLLGGSVQAQSYVEKMLSYKVTVHYPDHMVNAHVKPGGAPALKSDRQYYWFSGNQINMTQGGYSGKLLNGDYEDLYNNKNLKASGAFEQGLKTGVWKNWTEDGVLKDQFTFNEGQLDGTYVKYDIAGKIKEKGIYHHDLLEGKQEIVSADSTIVVYYHDGKIYTPKNIVPKFFRKFLPKKPIRSNQPK
ncbi:hypothetical protein SAMN06265348_103275 [Pedobacter westerhofensis]|uniref:MORN repeat variant n=1 Tax=Pedobacter westerhofensis TaxID=425512 RepID=A0A521C6P7_9SPHI|nr:hypothetical protein [Pedobacter westerhofensis]SMO55084.1 hypothetical protein SAMN06265348_103275 [Pedobacter westerhofensis]